MTRPAHVEGAILRAYRLESLLRVMSLATDGEQISNVTFEKSGGGEIINLAAEMAGEIIEGLELGEKAATRK